MDADLLMEDMLDLMDWEETRSVARARQFITSASRLLALRPVSSSFKSSSMAFDFATITEMIKRAQSFVAATDPVAGRGFTKVLGVSQRFRG